MHVATWWIQTNQLDHFKKSDKNKADYFTRKINCSIQLGIFFKREQYS